MRRLDASSRAGGWPALLLFALAAVAVACGAPRDGGANGPEPSARPGTTTVFTPARPTFAQAVRDFFGVRPRAVQPIAFRHDIHIEKGLRCRICHAGVATGPIAGLPSVTRCMLCHVRVATDRPVIQEVTAYRERGEEIPWQRVYGYPAISHVRFHHAAHVRAEIECATCHGDMAQQTVAERVVDLDMGYCVNCHRERQVSTDCLTCHY